MLLPESCSVKVDGNECRLPPSYVVSIVSHDGEYMIAVVCEQHKEGLQYKLTSMQNEGKLPAGKIHFQTITAVVTDCVKGMEEDYVEIDLKRGLSSERKP